MAVHLIRVRLGNDSLGPDATGDLVETYADWLDGHLRLAYPETEIDVQTDIYSGRTRIDADTDDECREVEWRLDGLFEEWCRGPEDEQPSCPLCNQPTPTATPHAACMDAEQARAELEACSGSDSRSPQPSAATDAS